MSVKKYLQSYAEAEISLTDELRSFLIRNRSESFNDTINNDTTFQYQRVLTIPAYNESDSLITRIKRLNCSQSVLVILVINAPEQSSSPDNQALQQTQALCENFKQHYPLLTQLSPTAHLLELNASLCQHLLLVEHCSTGHFLPPKEGVGLARKIACDIACQLINDNVISTPWIHSTDADVSLPEDYFNAGIGLNPKEVALALYPFAHTHNPDQQVNLAQNLYECSLYYYVEGLCWAGSPYGFHTIGSTFLINHEYYAACRGFPKRAAGEDFYLLNKMAKVGKIVALEKPTLIIDSRLSERVPFGTGPALNKITQLKSPYEDYLYYHPGCFVYLQQWLNCLPVLWKLLEKAKLDNMPLDESYLNALLKQLLQVQIISTDLALDNLLLYQCLQSLKINTALKHGIQQSKSEESFLQHMHSWFDAFKTLKFIHYLRRKSLASINARTLETQAVFISKKLKDKIKKLSLTD